VATSEGKLWSLGGTYDNSRDMTQIYELDCSADLGEKYLGFFSSCSLKMREKYISFAHFVYFLREVNFIIQKLKSKHTSLLRFKKNIQTEQN
jgi:hypothetical protein